jgi:hypothetical protein
LRRLNSTIHKIKEANITFKEIFLGLHGNSSDIEINSYIKTNNKENNLFHIFLG